MKINMFSRISLLMSKTKSSVTRFGLAILIALGTLCCSQANAATTNYVPGRVLVKLKSGVASARLDNFNKTQGVQSARLMKAGNYTWQVVEFSPLIDVHEKIREYMKSGLVLWAEPDYYYTIAKIPNDPSFSVPDHCYSFKNTHATAAWDTITDAPDVIVAVVDSGVQYNHFDLVDNMWVNPNEIPDNGIDDDGNGIVDDVHGANFTTKDPIGDPMDDNRHGTHVAGTIGASGNNSLGVAGVTWKTQIMALKVMGADGKGSSVDIVNGVRYAREHGANVINMSLGGGGYSQIAYDEYAACQRAGIIIVAAAGNETTNNDTTPSYPASYCLELDNIISVGSCDDRNKVSYFSNYGKKSVHLFAPGSDIWSTALKQVGDSYDNDAYESLSGTSMACPFVAGATALCIAAHPDDTYLQIKNRILNGVDPVAAFSKKCSTGGLINVDNIVHNLITEDGFEYTVSNGKASIIGYKGTNMNPVLPNLIKDYYPVVSIAKGAFMYQPIESIIVSENVLTIESSAFENCSKLVSIILGPNVYSIGANTFQGCSALTEINLPAAITTLGSGWLIGCTSLQNINVDPANTTYSSQNGILLSKDGTILMCFPSAKPVVGMVIPPTVNTIGDSAFAYTQLTNITLPNSVRRVNQNAFSFCDKLESVAFGEEFTSIGIYAFYECTALKSLHFPGNAPAAMNISFEECSPTVYYSSAKDGWVLDDEGLWYGLKVVNTSTTSVTVDPRISYRIEDGKMIITFKGILYSSTNNIDWVKVEGAESPYTVDPSVGTLFYRVDME
ncbi:MAG: S8 family serine peptidase [Verrucomicrobia bacterium]|nr:S8 family serine peptidase [Verrucomicrobiota bacterium]